jgi:XTP/dITP diphosphohydrolase
VRGPILLATRSTGKLRELHALFREYGYPAIDLEGAGIPEHADEDGLEAYDTFELNALAKAHYFARLSGMPVVADDSGLEVRALGGRPGVHSKRWSARPGLSGHALDQANNQRLVTELAAVDDRAARYVCVAAYVDGPREMFRRGEVNGEIVLDPRGEGGFGYDPFFFSPELGCTFGEAALAAKGEVSHRARAFRALLDAMRAEERAENAGE